MSTLKRLEMALSHQSESEWQQEADEAARARAILRAEYALANIITEEIEHVVRGALYHAGKLEIGCENKPRVTYSHNRTDSELWGAPASTRDSQSDRAFSLGER